MESSLMSYGIGIAGTVAVMLLWVSVERWASGLRGPAPGGATTDGHHGCLSCASHETCAEEEGPWKP